MDIIRIFKSKVRRDLFRLYFTNPEKSYYLRELERVLNIPVAMLRKELIALEKAGIFASSRKSNLCYYALNKIYPLYSELKSIVSKTVGVEGSLRDMLSSIKGVKLAFIYGSFAAQKEKGDSDIDLMIIGDPYASGLHIKVAELEQKLKREINLTVYSLKEYKAKKKAKGGFITDLLKNPKIILIGRENDL